MDTMSKVFEAIPQIAGSPIALVAYLGALAVWGILFFRIKTLSTVNATITNLPEKDRLPVLRAALGEVDVKQFTPIEYIKLQRSKYMLYAFLVLCAVAVVITALAVRESFDKEQHTNDVIGRLLANPPSQYRSSFNVIANGPMNLASIGHESSMQPDISDAELSSVVDQMVLQGLDFNEITARLKGGSSGGQLQKANSVLQKAALRLNDFYLDIADCFVDQRCTTNADAFTRMCRQTGAIENNIREINSVADSIPGVTMNQSGSKPLFGDGIMDKYFEVVYAENIWELNKLCP